MRLGTKDILTLSELTSKEFSSLIRQSIKLKAEKKRKKSHTNILKDKSLVMIFQKPSTRTRVSFEIGMKQLGGHTVNLAASDMQLARGETIQDTAKTLSRYADGIMARVYEHDTIECLAQYSAIPVINGLSDMFHPCQILADFMTITEKKGKTSNIKISWIGDGNNVCNSMIYGAVLTGASMSIATPKKHQPASSVIKYAQKNTQIEITTDPATAAKDADVIITDTHNSIHNKNPNRINVFLPKYQITQKIMSMANPDAIFMHCLPAKRGQEVTADVIDGPQSVVWDEAENRLHTQKALLASLL